MTMPTEAAKAKKIAAAERELAKLQERRERAWMKHIEAQAEADRTRTVSDEYATQVDKARAWLDHVKAMPTSDGVETETEATLRDPDTMAALAEAEAKDHDGHTFTVN